MKRALGLLAFCLVTLLLLTAMSYGDDPNMQVGTNQSQASQNGEEVQFQDQKPASLEHPWDEPFFEPTQDETSGSEEATTTDGNGNSWVITVFGVDFVIGW